MRNIGLKKALLLGRVLTRSGDQAWDFAVPLAILKVVPGQLQYAALYYFLIRLSNVFFLPRLSKLIDQISRFSAAKLGIIIQLFGVLIGFTSLSFLSYESFAVIEWLSRKSFLLLLLIIGGILGSLGSTFMDIAIANDLVPSSIKEDELPAFNSRLRQVDLFTELSAPIIAGWLLIYETKSFILFGFSFIAIWNLISFVPEYLLLKSIFKIKPELSVKYVKIPELSQKSIIGKLTTGWKSFLSEPIAFVSVAYACLWLSVLSPHGVLLTGFLKDGWSFPEWGIGIFRGLGGLFGLIATFLFPMMAKKKGIKEAVRIFVSFQLLTVTLALIFFFCDGVVYQILFLSLVLFSRIGLYGFSLGEVQIRQLNISPSLRGEYNGFASALTALATLGLYGGGALLPKTNDFKYLVVLSVATVGMAFVLYIVWLHKGKERA